ncbi:uncharacterized protein [Eurosta solidaginis]|uniref:uncharacterized protein isoform X2 n=1 Tax=Eurosta solidaginis TaxID=178769 RepID=UPI0035316036
MLTCRMVDTIPIIKVNTTHLLQTTSSNCPGFRLLDKKKLESNSSSGKNSVCKLKIDLMFDDTRSTISNRFNDNRGSHRTRSIIMYGRSELASAEESFQSISDMLQESTEPITKDVKHISNSVQEQIEKLFTDVAKDVTSSFHVICLGSLPLNDKITSLQGLQEPLRKLYLNELNTKRSGFLEICTTGLRVKINSNCGKEKNYENITPFHNIAVWSAVKFVQSGHNVGAAFLPLITDPENIDKASLFRPLCENEKKVESNEHAPIFTVVMRSANSPRILNCHAFVCKCREDAIVIAATLYQSLMAYVTSSYCNTERRTPRNENGISCISIASSSGRSNCFLNSRALSNGSKRSLRSSNESVSTDVGSTSRVGRKKGIPASSFTSSNNNVNEMETTIEEQKRTSHKSQRGLYSGNVIAKHITSTGIGLEESLLRSCEVKYKMDGEQLTVAEPLGYSSNSGLRSETIGDIMTRVAIPRSGSFLNTGGLARYKSRAARRHSGKLGGGNGSPLGFSELFNEFRLHENLHSLDDILYAIIDADGMSFNDLKPIYKEFLLKLAVTLTKDELFQRSKNIMRRQRKKKQNGRSTTLAPQKIWKPSIFGTKSLKKVFYLDQFKSCRGKLLKLKQNNNCAIKKPSPTAHLGNGKKCVPVVQRHARSSGSEVRKETTFHGFYRHSSSGYVSCSESSFGTCTSANRCYCSLPTDQIRLLPNNENNLLLSKSSTNINRDSLISCKSDDKCYCSIVEEVNGTVGGDFGNNQSDTTWCDSDSCISTSKCYCQQVNRLIRSKCVEMKTSKSYNEIYSVLTAGEKMALDYELFTINERRKSVQAHEAFSVKKSVEAAAIFADVKLNQTTDIKSMLSSSLALSSKTFLEGGTKDGSKKKQPSKGPEHSNMNRKNYDSILLSNSLTKSQKINNLLRTLKVLETNAESMKSPCNKLQTTLNEVQNRESLQSNNQMIRSGNESLVDTLGYLP